jgi:hypothetical protein
MTRLHLRTARRLSALALPALAWLMASSMALAQVPQAGAGAQATQPPLPPPQLAGRWDLNVAASDPAPTQLPQQGGGDADRGGGGGRGGRGGGTGGRRGTYGESSRGGAKEESPAVRQEMERAIEAPRFFIVVQREGSVILTDDQGRVTTLKPDGTKTVEQQAGGSIERTSRWDDRALVTATKLSNGAKVTQTFTKVFDGLQLVIVTRIEGGKLPSPMEFKRVYDQAFQ